MPTAAELRDRERLNVVWLVEITLKNSGPILYLSTKNIIVGGQPYEDYIEAISGMELQVNRLDSHFQNQDILITFNNDAYSGYNYLIEAGETYPFEGATCVIKECLLDDSNTPATPTIIYKGYLDEPRKIDINRFECSVSSIFFWLARRWKQGICDKATFPNAYEDVGKALPIVIGASVRLPAVRVDWGAKNNLKANITSAVTSIELSDASRFPSSGTLLCDAEKISYTGKSTNTLTGCTRGASATTATAHKAGAEVWIAQTNYDSVLCNHDIHTQGDIFAEVDNKLLRVTSGVSGLLSSGRYLLRATSQITVESAGLNDGITVSDNIGFTSAATMKKVIPSSAAGGTNPGSAIDGNGTSYCTLVSGETLTISFPSTSYGAIANQLWYINVHINGSSSLFINGTWTIGAGSGDFRFTSAGGNWGDQLTIYCNAGTGRLVIEAWKEVEYTPTLTKSGAASRSGAVTSLATIQVDRFHAVVSGAKDDGSGTYTGTAGALIERPDHAIKWFLIAQIGLTAAEIDSAAFSAAGSLYASAISGGYKFATAIVDQVDIEKTIKQLAYECRSALQWRGEKFYLDYLPDTSPAAVKTISQAEIAEEYGTFVFDRTDLVDLANDLTVKFQRDYSALNSESDWLGTATASDSASKTKFGTYPLPRKDEEFAFEYIRSQAMADHVLAHILLQRKIPLLIVRFPIFWEHLDLSIGSTFDISSGLYNGKKFFVEKFKRIDAFAGELIALGWW